MKAKFYIVIVLYIISIFVPLYLSSGYFDMQGKKYSTLNDIRYYSEDGKVYKIEYIENTDMLVEVNDKIDKTDKKRASDCVINMNGLVVFNIKPYLNKTKKEGVLADEKGDIFFEFGKVTWNRLGIMNVDEFISDSK